MGHFVYRSTAVAALSALDGQLGLPRKAVHVEAAILLPLESKNSLSLS